MSTFYDKYVTTHYQYVANATHASFRSRYYVWKSYMVDLLPKSRDSKILEIGCGVGHNLYALRQLGYKNILGTDYSAECVKVCKQNGFNSFIVNEKTEKQFYASKKNIFDVVILYDVLEHYTPDQAMVLLKAVYAMLRHDGSMLISLPNANHPLSNSLFFADITHKFIYNEISMAQLLRNCRYTNINFKQINSFSIYDDMLLKYVAKRYILPVFAAIGELHWRIVALMQGIFLPECKPTLIVRAFK